ncbi:MAG: glycerol-3-phosphate acyltransferase [Candidatus Faecousia sp.]|nr:glycerol-3-phosphate acyltransferase [Clostridiales bacterium]MDD5883448.1 glycerol-3-phosphate acyltransferase [Bacillota bacterium]MDY4599184.1 glycerol-3-phosphate acyltransferase [Candidatus Faecousia sp.]
MVLSIVITAVAAYLLGNLNGAVVISRIVAHEDVRTKGSGNAGLTNFTRNYGAASSIFVIAIDVGKAVAACLLGGLLLEDYGHYMDGVALGGLFVILGHDFPALLGFKGGKGILSGVTVALMMDWRIGLFVFGIFLVAYALTKYVSLGSILSSGAFGPIYAFVHWGEGIFPIVVGFVLSALIVWMHRSNILRLMKGEERKTNLLGKGKKQ